MLTRVEFQFPQAPKLEKLTENEKKLLEYVEDIKKAVAETFRTLNRPGVLTIDQATINEVSGGSIQITSASNPAAGSGQGLELAGGANPYIQAYDRNAGAYLPLQFTGTEFQFSPGGVEKLRLTDDGRLYGTALHDNAGAVTGATNQYIASGTYTPTLTNTTNITSSSASVCQWLRVGNVVTVSGKATVEPTSTGTVTRLGISLPIASGLASSTELGGAGTYNGTNLRDVVCFAGDATNDRVEASFFPNATSSSDLPFSFTYLVK